MENWPVAMIEDSASIRGHKKDPTRGIQVRYCMIRVKCGSHQKPLEATKIPLKATRRHWKLFLYKMSSFGGFWVKICASAKNSVHYQNTMGCV